MFAYVTELTIAWPPLLPHPVARRGPADLGLGNLRQRRRRQRRRRGFGRQLLGRRSGRFRRRRPSGPLAQPRQTRHRAALGREADFARAVRTRPLVAAALGRLDVPPGGSDRRRGTAIFDTFNTTCRARKYGLYVVW